MAHRNCERVHPESVTEAIWTYALELVAADLVWLRRYSDELPGKFSSLLREESAPRALEELKMWFKLLEEFEEKVGDPECKLSSFWQAMPWAASPWVREVFVGLAEAEFVRVPSDLLVELQAVARCWRQSVFCERAFNYCRDRSRHSKSGFMGAKLRFHTLLNSSLMADSDRPQGSAEPKRPMPGRFPADTSELFDARSADSFSLGEAYLDTMMATGHTMGPSRFLSSNLAWAAVRECTSTSWRRLHSVWHSLLPRKHQMLWPRTRGLWLVLSTSPYAVLALACITRTVGGNSYVDYKLDVEGQLIPSALVLYDSDDWTCRPITVLPPGDSRYHAPASGYGSGPCMFLDPAQPGLRLLRAAATDALRGLTVPQLLQIVDEYSVEYEGRKPSIESAVVRLLVAWQFPKYSAEQLDAVCARRGARSRQVFASVLTPANVQHLSDAAAGLDKGEVQSMQETAEKVMTTLQAMPKAKVFLPAAPPGSGSSSSAGAGSSSSGAQVVKDWRQLPQLPEGSWTQAQAKMYLPDVRGCVISVHKNSAWMIKYPTVSLPRSRSQAFAPGDESSNSEALRLALVWAWRAHKEKTGLPCPWNLGEPI